MNLKDTSMGFTNMTTRSVTKYTINPSLVFPSIYKGQSEVIRRKDLDSNSQWHRDIITCMHMHV